MYRYSKIRRSGTFLQIGVQIIINYDYKNNIFVCVIETLSTNVIKRSIKIIKNDYELLKTQTHMFSVETFVFLYLIGLLLYHKRGLAVRSSHIFKIAPNCADKIKPFLLIRKHITPRTVILPIFYFHNLLER